MSGYIGDTVFGQLVRLLSKRQLLKFPDEKSPKIYESFVKRHANNSSDLKIMEKAGNIEQDNTSQVNGQNCKIPDESGLRHDATDIVLVDWYGRDDPEAS